jgi:3',5'-cyclic-AMP phosphodiesterase
VQPVITNNGSYRLVQVTDPHLFADPQHVLVGMNCDEGLRDVLALISATEKSVTGVLMTGDASQDHSLASYQRLHGLVSQLGVPQYWLPGNHDELMVMQDAVGVDNPCFDKTIRFGEWLVVMLSSNEPGAVHGVLHKNELEFLEQTLQSTTAKHVLVCLHHNPIAVEAAWLQRHALQNSAELFAILDRHSQVKGVVFGHIHHELNQIRNGVAYHGAPSTCVQFHPYSEEFALDGQNPGYRWLELCVDGTLLTGVNRVSNKSYSVDFSGIGY